MFKKVIGLVLILCVLAAAVHFIPWPKSYDHTLKGVVLEFSNENGHTTLYTSTAEDISVKLDMVQKHYLLSDMVLGGSLQVGTRTLETIEVNRFDKAQMNNASLFPKEDVWKNEVEELFGSTLVFENSTYFMTIYSNYDMNHMILEDWGEGKIYLLSKEPFDLEASLEYFGQYDSFFFSEVEE